MGATATAALIALLVLAAVIDARERRLPNQLACALAVTALARAVSVSGLPGALLNVVAACIASAVLVVFERVWRAARGEAGQGMGDIKALCALMIAWPSMALAAYAVALALLAVTGIMLRARALPLMPYLAATMLAALVMPELLRLMGAS